MYSEFIELAKEKIESKLTKDRMLQQEEIKLKLKLKEIEEQRSKLLLTASSLDAFLEIEKKYSDPCPFCFFGEALEIEMRPHDSGDNDYDAFQCPNCNSKIDVKIDK